MGFRNLCRILVQQPAALRTPADEQQLAHLALNALLFEEGTEDLDVPMLTGALRAELFRGKARARTAEPMKPAELLGHWPVGDEEER